MTAPVRIRDVRLTSVHAGDAAGGLVGFVACVVDDHLQIDGIALRQSRDGRLTLSLPQRCDRTGRAHPPIDGTVRQEIEAAVFTALGMSQEATP